MNVICRYKGNVCFFGYFYYSLVNVFLGQVAAPHSPRWNSVILYLKVKVGVSLGVLAKKVAVIKGFLFRLINFTRLNKPGNFPGSAGGKRDKPLMVFG